MAGDFLRRLIAKTPRPEVREAIDELTRLAAERPSLAEPCRFLREVLPVLFAEPVAPPIDITAERTRTKLSGGVPVLRGEMVEPDPAFARRWRATWTAAGKTAPDSATARNLLNELLTGQPDALATRATESGLDPGIATTALRLTVLPWFAAIHRDAVRWEHGFCPICGSWPLLGEFRGLEQQRFLRCGVCAGGWESPRLRCPFCATTDHQQLGYFFVESEEGKYRVSTCAACRGYVKMISTLTELSPMRLLVADVATLHLDLAAADRGFFVP